MEEEAQQILASLRATPDVLGIILYGSRARGNARADSDYDLLVIVKQGFRKAIERRVGTTFEIIYTTEQSCAAYWQGSKDDCVDLWQVAKVLFDRDGTVQRLKEVADRIKASGKDPLPAEEIAIARFEIFDQFKAIRSLAGSDETTAKMLLASHVLRLSALYFDLRQLWTPPPKQRLAALKTLDPQFFGFLEEYFAGKALARQIALVEKMAARVFDTAN